MSEWQPIETMPEGMEGRIMVWAGENEHQIVYADWFIDRDGKREFFNGDIFIDGSTHWKELCAPPK